jgi:segregation and condensation protein B
VIELAEPAEAPAEDDTPVEQPPAGVVELAEPAEAASPDAPTGEAATEVDVPGDDVSGDDVPEELPPPGVVELAEPAEAPEVEQAHDEPAADEPAADEPATDEPAAGAPGTDELAPVPLGVSGDAEGEAPAGLSDAQLRGALEAVLLVVDEPVGEMMLAQVLDEPTDRVATALGELRADYTASGRGFELRQAAGGWRLYTRTEFAPYVERFVLDGQQTRLTQAALETLAVIAYKQPVTRSRISAIRGVNCDGVIKTLVGRGLVEECGTERDSGAILYQTTVLFLEKLGINSVGELPGLAPFLPDNVDEIDAHR